MFLLLFLDTTYTEHVGIRKKEMIHLVDRTIDTVGEELNLMGSLFPPLVRLQLRTISL